MIPVNEADALSIFVDEAGDPTLFKGRRGTPLVGSPGCSRFFILGKLEVENPAVLAHKLKVLRTELLNDLYFTGVESFRPERKKTAHAFHAKDDLPDVRYRVFSLLCAEGSALRFHAVVCDKNALLDREQTKREANPAYRYQPNALYDSLVRSLFSKFHRLADRYELCVARRGQKDRNEALTLALEHAEGDFEATFGYSRGGSAAWRITVSDPGTEACLQSVDYFLWALQRFYEQRLHPLTGEAQPREDRYLNLLWPQMAEIHDLDFGTERGTYFNKQRHLALDERFESGKHKKKKP
ncbi:MAG: DUF3800 domain-containing protein [Methylococcales bacterium]|nr:DUF3800 domain-containing protein [Methylococcales bacterium]MDD5631492.1 DUF3800 domain-containing protein [Methylococcales bacterium]